MAESGLLMIRMTVGMLGTSIVSGILVSLAPVFWYLIPFLLLAFVLTLFLREIPLSHESGMVARGEAIDGEAALEAERALLEAKRARRAGRAGPKDARWEDVTHQRGIPDRKMVWDPSLVCDRAKAGRYCAARSSTSSRTRAASA